MAQVGQSKWWLGEVGKCLCHHASLVRRHVGTNHVGYEMVQGGRYGDRNVEGMRFIDILIASDLIPVNRFYLEMDEHLITFKYETNQRQIDFILTKKEDRVIREKM